MPVRPQSSGFGGDKCSHCGCAIPHAFCWDMAPQGWQRTALRKPEPESPIQVFAKYGRKK